MTWGKFRKVFNNNGPRQIHMYMSFTKWDPVSRLNYNFCIIANCSYIQQNTINTQKEGEIVLLILQFIYLSIYPSTHPSIHLFIYLSIFLSFYIYLSIYLFIYLFIIIINIFIYE